MNFLKFRMSCVFRTIHDRDIQLMRVGVCVKPGSYFSVCKFINKRKMHMVQGYVIILL